MRVSPSRMVMTVFLVVLAMGIANRVQAQTVVTCKVPLEFSIGGESFPSGVYTFASIGSGESRTILARNRVDSHARLISAQIEDESSSVGTAVSFNRYGRHDALSSVSIAGEAISVHIAPTKAEREMACREPREVVSIMANR